MWSMLVIARDLLSALDAGAGREPLPGPAPAFVEHTQALLDRNAAPDHVRHRWEDIIGDSGGVMPKFPLPGCAPSAARACRKCAMCSISTTVQHLLRRPATTASTRTRCGCDDCDDPRVGGNPLRAVFPCTYVTTTTGMTQSAGSLPNSVLESRSRPRAAAAAVKRLCSLARGRWRTYWLHGAACPWLSRGYVRDLRIADLQTAGANRLHRTRRPLCRRDNRHRQRHAGSYWTVRFALEMPLSRHR